MPERNVDKIKRLEKELRAAGEKNAAANLEIVRQREMAREAREGAREVGMTCDALLTAAALKFGSQVGPGAWELHLPRVDVMALLGEYELTGGSGGEQCRLRVVKRGEDGAGGV